ncbi:diguanylate cyclase [Longispora sp. K20-0274]|uniref:GGDEF domain-containing protein n=1 Tax=Longispora sp. K20-0274 TaxID=3088255 RepID=UPI00399A5870
MTLRARLTAAFLAVVLGPVLLGAVFVGGAVAAVGRSRSAERLELADSTARTTIEALCVKLRSAAESAAVQSNGGRTKGVAGQLVTSDRAAGVRILDPGGETLDSSGELPEPWSVCGAADPQAHGSLESLVAWVPIRDSTGTSLGTAIAAEPLDQAFVGRLAAATGVGVTLLDDRGLSTARERQRPEIRAVTRVGGTVETPGGLYVHRLSGAHQLPLALFVEHSDPQGLYAALFGIVAVAGLLSVVAAWMLARSTTRPLVELARAADRVADGDLDARVPVRGDDELGRLATAFNRMTRETQGYVAALTASRDQLREAMRLSRTDPLTGLANYRHLEESLRWEVEKTTRYARPLAVIALDLDLFKEVNDTYGHPAGDAVLVEVSRRLEGEIRDMDRAFRQGGEEFVLLLPETDLAGAVSVAERLGSALRDSAVLVEPAGHAIKVTVSIGVAVYPEHGDTGPKVLAAADDALYAAKAAGRDTYRIARGGALS